MLSLYSAASTISGLNTFGPPCTRRLLHLSTISGLNTLWPPLHSATSTPFDLCIPRCLHLFGLYTLPTHIPFNFHPLLVSIVYPFYQVHLSSTTSCMLYELYTHRPPRSTTYILRLYTMQCLLFDLYNHQTQWSSAPPSFYTTSAFSILFQYHHSVSDCTETKQSARPSVARKLTASSTEHWSLPQIKRRDRVLLWCVYLPYPDLVLIFLVSYPTTLLSLPPTTAVLYDYT